MSLQRVYVSGHTGMVGSAIVRALERDGKGEVLTARHSNLDLTEQNQVRAWLRQHRPEAVVVAAARVGGIHANSTYPADFIYQNLAIATNLVHESFQVGVRRLLFLGSSCIYPVQAPQPMAETALLTGPLEVTNEAYAIAKIAGLKLCQFYRQQHGVLYHSAMPTNLYGQGDNYHPENSHVIPGLLRRFHAARVRNEPKIVIWGTGKPLREFLHVDELASACLHLLKLKEPPDLVNIGSGEENTIHDLAHLIAKVVGYQGQIEFDATKPDGSPRKLMDSSLLRSTGWAPAHSLESGLADTYQDFRQLLESGKLREV